MKRRPIHSKDSVKQLTNIWGKCQKQRVFGNQLKTFPLFTWQTSNPNSPLWSVTSWINATVAEGTVSGFGEEMSKHDTVKKSPRYWPFACKHCLVWCQKHRGQKNDDFVLYFQSFWCQGPALWVQKFQALSTVLTVFCGSRAWAHWELELEDSHVSLASIHL